MGLWVVTACSSEPREAPDALSTTDGGEERPGWADTGVEALTPDGETDRTPYPVDEALEVLDVRDFAEPDPGPRGDADAPSPEDLAMPETGPEVGPDAEGPPVMDGLVIEWVSGDHIPWGSKLLFRVWGTWSAGGAEPVEVPREHLLVSVFGTHVLELDEDGDIWGVGVGTGMVRVALEAPSGTLEAQGKVVVYMLDAEPPPNDRCDGALDATDGLWIPLNLMTANDDYDPPSPCLDPSVGFSGPDVVFRLAPASDTEYEVLAHPAAFFDPMISLVDGCGAVAQCLASAREHGEGEDEVLRVTAPGGRDSFVLVEGQTGGSGWVSVTVSRVAP